MSHFSVDSRNLLHSMKNLNLQLTTSKVTERTFAMFYERICGAHNKLLIKDKKGVNVLKRHCSQFSLNKIANINELKVYDFNHIQKSIRDHITTHCSHKLIYTVSAHSFGMIRNININFYIEDLETFNKDHYDVYVYRILLWLQVADELAKNKSCSPTLTIVLYFTKLKKNLPKVDMEVIDYEHINTGYTTSCYAPNHELRNGNDYSLSTHIVIYRKEEWYKVFVHETIHNLGLDFATENPTESVAFILNLYPVKSLVKLYEAYTDTWAKIINCLLCSFYQLHDKKDRKMFEQNVECNMRNEHKHVMLQVSKVLKHYNLRYDDMISTDAQTRALVMNKYKEKTSILSYYIISSALINDLESFFEWCEMNNEFSILQFRQNNQESFCEYIESKYKDGKLLKNIKIIQNFLSLIDRKTYSYTNLRKSVMEIC
jgi:hypothetical protein